MAVNCKVVPMFGHASTMVTTPSEDANPPPLLMLQISMLKAYVKLAELKRGSGVTQSFRAFAFQTQLSRTETWSIFSLYIH